MLGNVEQDHNSVNICHRNLATLAQRCLGAAVEAVTEMVEVVVGDNITSTPMDHGPPAAPASSIPTWA